MNETRADDFIKVGNDHTMGPRDRPPLVNSAGSAIASEQTHLCILERNDGAFLISLAFYVGKIGIYHPLTPDGARFLADKMLKAADDAEQSASLTSNAQLASVLNKGTGHG